MQAQLKAVILDMDGVLTQTARLHAKAWKEMFDRYNQRRINSGKEGFAAFTLDDERRSRGSTWRRQTLRLNRRRPALRPECPLTGR